MKSFALIVGLLVLAVSWNSWACSIQLNHTLMKNDLIHAAANEFSISLDKVTKITLTDYSTDLVGEVPGSSCEKYLVVEAHVVINYKKSAFETCELSLDVRLQEEIEAEVYPFQNYSYDNLASSCSFSRPVIIRPPGRRVPIPRL
jgi:hypothetical protein